MKLSFVLFCILLALPTTLAMSPLQQHKNMAVKVSVQRGRGGGKFEAVPRGLTCRDGLVGMRLYVKEYKTCLLFWTSWGWLLKVSRRLTLPAYSC